MKEIEELYKQIAKTENAINKNIQHYNKPMDEVNATKQEGNQLKKERETLKCKLLDLLDTANIVGLCFKKKEKDIMCQVMEFNEEDYYHLKVTHIHRDLGIIPDLMVTETLVSDYTVVPFDEYTKFKDEVLSKLCDLKPQKKK